MPRGSTTLDWLARLRSLGFDGENARVLDVLPLVLVAWADGSVSSAERAVVMRAVEARGVDPHGEAGLKVAALLEKKPSPAMENEILLILRTWWLLTNAGGGYRHALHSGRRSHPDPVRAWDKNFRRGTCSSGSDRH